MESLEQQKTKIRRQGWGMMIALLLGLGFVLVYPTFTEFRKFVRGEEVYGKMKSITMALHHYHDTYHCFPPAYDTERDWQATT